MRVFLVIFIIFIMFFLIFSVVVVDSSFNEIISMFVFEMLLFIILDYVNKVFIVLKFGVLI